MKKEFTRRFFLKTAPVVAGGILAFQAVPVLNNKPTGVTGLRAPGNSRMNRWKIYSEPDHKHVGYMNEIFTEVQNGDVQTRTYEYVFANLKGSNYPLAATGNRIEPYML